MLLRPLSILYNLVVINLLLMFMFAQCKQGQEGSTRGVGGKASFDRLNKVFDISAAKRNHQVLLMDRNLLVVVRESKSFILPILPRLAPQSLVPSEHHVLKNLPYYEVDCVPGLLRTKGEKTTGGEVKASYNHKPLKFKFYRPSSYQEEGSYHSAYSDATKTIVHISFSFYFHFFYIFIFYRQHRAKHRGRSASCQLPALS